ncbi:putative mitogen-activated protein kinase kinase kinase 7-like [Acanthaster planci]|uniref:Mitogen-activated protein kinase kinase kinase 7-like n=1 Tax=Acanthaster planci TaxID=133434 RepID=A0A8B7ZM07_ACAPL|nr:putative mitogen-activated protein kinase kinase kinase 7-like [Acanthaster planci]
MASAFESSANRSEFSTQLPEIPKHFLTCKRKLGEGGFGEVYKAHHIQWGELAVKVCKQSTRLSDEDKKHVRREIERMTKVARHENIVSIRGIIPDVKPFDCCIAMDYMKHGSLRSCQKKLGTFPNAVKIRMIKDISLGMNFLHTQKEPIIHRDLKLENVLVNEHLVVKVSDFGLATWRTASNFKDAGGTISHIPPENLRNLNQKCTTKYDVYSFGIMLWELSSNQESYLNCKGNPSLISSGVARGQRPDMALIPSDEPAIVKELMEQSWHQDARKRPDFQEIKEKIDGKYQEYEKDFLTGLHETLKQLRELTAKQDESNTEVNRFPWEQQDIPDSKNETVKDGGSVEWRANGTPLTLQSKEPRVNDKDIHVGFPVAVSDAQKEQQPAGMSRLITPMENLSVNCDKYGMAETSPHEPTQLPTCVGQAAASVPDTSVPANCKSQYETDSLTDHLASSDQHHRLLSSGQTVKSPPSKQEGVYPAEDGKLSPPNLENRQSKTYHQTNVPDPYPREPPKGNNASGININVKGDGNVITVSRGKNTVQVDKQKHRERKKKKKYKTRSPTPSSSSSSDETDSSVPGPSITTSNESVTEQDIRDLDEHIGKKYKRLGRNLGLLEAHIENIEGDHFLGGRQEIAFQIMLAWQRSQGAAATKAALAEALEKTGLRNVAEKL